MDLLIMNYQWVFSGIGVAVLGWLFVRRKSRAGVSQSVKSSSSISQHHFGTGDNVAGDKITNNTQTNPQQNTIHRATKYGITTTKVINPNGVTISEQTTLGE